MILALVAYVGVLGAGTLWLLALRAADREAQLSVAEREWLEDVIERLDSRRHTLNEVSLADPEALA